MNWKTFVRQPNLTNLTNQPTNQPVKERTRSLIHFINFEHNRNLFKGEKKSNFFKTFSGFPGERKKEKKRNVLLVFRFQCLDWVVEVESRNESGRILCLGYNQ